MKHQKTTFNSLLIRYNKYRKKLIRLHKAGKNEHRQIVLKRHIERLYVKLTSVTIGISKQAALATSFTALMTLSTENANAQTQFKENTINRFSLTPLPGPYTYGSIAKVDFDSDGDLDLLTNHYDGNFRYYENTGSATVPNFANSVQNPFSLVDAGGYGVITAADMDNDGDTDVLVNQYGSGDSYKFYENTGTSSSPVFAAPVSSAFGLPSSGYASSMQLVDMDADNDYDLMVFNGANCSYFENIGSVSTANFTASVINPFSISSILYQAKLVDLDNDGDLDLFGTVNGAAYYMDNVGSAQNATFSAAAPNPFSIQITFPNTSGLEVLDIDNDGDQDFIYNNSRNGDFHFFENIGTNLVPKFTDGHTNLFSLTDLGSTPDPTFGDLDNDGDLDMLTEVNGVLYYFENIGNAVNPNFAAAVQNPFSLPGYGNNGSNCALVDIDGDNDLDLFMAYSNNFQFIENVGTASAPSFGPVQSAPFGIQNGNGFQFPEFVDLDNDGDFDVLSQSGIYGDIYYYQNTGTSSSPSFAAPMVNPFGFVTQGDRNNITVGDIDGDGDFDVIAGKNEVLNKDEFFFYENTGTASSPMFALSLSDPFNLRPVGSNNANPISTNPCIVDLDNNGVMDLMVGVQSGYYTFFENISVSTAGISINDIAKETISIYPNPATSTIKIESTDKIKLIAIYDLQGSLVDTTESDLYSVNHLETGVYIVIVKTENGIAQSKFVKQ